MPPIQSLRGTAQPLDEVTARGGVQDFPDLLTQRGEPDDMLMLDNEAAMIHEDDLDLEAVPREAEPSGALMVSVSGDPVPEGGMEVGGSRERAASPMARGIGRCRGKACDPIA